uniref:F-box domain-containing protein n=1 Tax=Mycena chlorophos TaxID=658473 RepID=A0ABQ0LQN8_MYCCL|nr:predicted protein [Mycena chlorophos]
MLLSQLSDDLVQLICLELPPESIRTLRQVSRRFNVLTRGRALWINLLRPILASGGIIPNYVGNHNELEAGVLEHLVFRLAALREAAQPEGDCTQPMSLPTLGMKLSRSITWLRLVGGNWLVVAASDRCQSQLLCYELSDPTNITCAYLPGRVQTGTAEIQGTQIVLALGLGPEYEALHVVTLCKHSQGQRTFAELARLEGSSHVLALSGDFVQCAMRGGLSIPHLYDWKHGAVVDIPPPPGGLDVPLRRAVPHLMHIWEDRIVVVRSGCIELFHVRDKAVISFMQIVETSPIWEVEVCSPKDASPCSLHLAAISEAGIELLVLEELDGRVHLRRSLIVENPPPIPIEENEYGLVSEPPSYPPFYGLCVGSSGKRVTWISAREAFDLQVDWSRLPLRLYQATVCSIDEEIALSTYTIFNPRDDPALWGVPCRDFDDALGLLVMGDCFGELAVFDYACAGGNKSLPCARVSPDLVGDSTNSNYILSQEPIPLNLLSYAYERMPDEEAAASRASRWAHDNLELNSSWRPAAFSREFDLYFASQHAWEGIPCDRAWMLEHLYGHPGEVLLQATQYNNPYGGSYEVIIFRIGKRYFEYAQEHDRDTSESFFSWPASTLQPYGPPQDDPQPLHRTRETARSARFAFSVFMTEDKERYSRDRLQEQRDRGGCPFKPDLVFMSETW